MTVAEDLDPSGWKPTASVMAAEEAVIGSVIQSRAAAETAAEFVQAHHFFRPAHQLVFEAVTTMVGDGHDVNPVAVLAELTRTGELMRVGGAPELFRLMERSFFGSLSWCAQVVQKDHTRRALHEFGTMVKQVTGSPDFDGDQQIDHIRKQLESAAAPVVGDAPPTAGEVLFETLDLLEKPLSIADYVPPPYQDLEMLLGGFRPGHLVILGARPAMGKTLVALDMARGAAVRLRLPTLLFSLEMSRTEIMQRLIAAEASVEQNRMNTRTLNDDDWAKITKIRDRVAEAPLVIDDSPSCTVARIRARLRGMIRSHGSCRLVVIDYLGLLEVGKAENRERAIADTTRALKLLAKEFEVPIILLVQLNRMAEHRSDRKPQTSDLRESGAIENDADVVILLYREDAYDKESPRAGELDLIVSKNRHGPMATITVAFQGRYARAVDLAPSGMGMGR